MSLLWPSASVAVLLVLSLGLVLLRQRGRLASSAVSAVAFGLLALEGAFLVSSGSVINTYAETAFIQTPAIAALQHAVGDAELGIDAGNTSCAAGAPHAGAYCGIRYWRKIGIYPEINLGYGIDELAMYDPTIPQAYIDVWPVPNASQRRKKAPALFVPDVDSLALARLYGVSYVLSLPGLPPPAGMVLVGRISGEPLYRVPGASRFSLVAAGTGGHLGTAKAEGDAAWELDVDLPRPAQLAAAITDVPGWHATADGRPVEVSRGPGDLLRVALPAGRSRVHLYYWPAQFSEGLVLAAAAVIVLAGAALLLALRRRMTDNGLTR